MENEIVKVMNTYGFWGFNQNNHGLLWSNKRKWEKWTWKKRNNKKEKNYHKATCQGRLKLPRNKSFQRYSKYNEATTYGHWYKRELKVKAPQYICRDILPCPQQEKTRLNLTSRQLEKTYPHHQLVTSWHWGLRVYWYDQHRHLGHGHDTHWLCLGLK